MKRSASPRSWLVRLFLVLAAISVSAGAVALAQSSSTSPEGGTSDEITAVDDFPDSAKQEGGEAVFNELDARVVEWERNVGRDSMSTPDRAHSIDLLTKAQAEVSEGPEAWLETLELGFRRHSLCLALPPEHEYRGGEFCD